MTFIYTVATMTWLTVTQYRSHKWSRICSHLSSFMTYHSIFDKRNMTGATSRARTAYPSDAPEFSPFFLVVFHGFMLLNL